MRDCLRTRALLPRLAAKEAGPLETLEARRHLDGCERCRGRMETMASAWSRQRRSGDDIAASVMDRLRAMRSQAVAQGLSFPLGSRWSSLGLLLGAGLTALCLPGAPISRALGRPLEALHGWLSGDVPQRMGEFAGAAVPLAARAAQGGLHLELPISGPPELMIGLQILATALGILFTVAIPAGALAAWLVRESRRS